MTAPDADTIVRAARAALGDIAAEIPSWQRTPIQWFALDLADEALAAAAA